MGGVSPKSVAIATSPLAKRKSVWAPSCLITSRDTSAKRTASITCWLPVTSMRLVILPGA